MKYLTIRQAADLMGVSPKQALRRLTRWHKLDLSGKVLIGGPKLFHGRYFVNPIALGRIMRDCDDNMYDLLNKQVDILQSDVLTLCERVRVLEDLTK